ncbi:amino acid ABC transporter permease [Terrarubrum flagellatum]|uniref:amino acid ABC transporter permease n=1 Tax=Terrirubrum flagellatum TaxID=2895980 RepID=UPI0031451AA9
MLREFGPNEVVYLLMATRWTIALSLVAFFGGGLLGLLLAVLRVSPLTPLRLISALFIQLFQATPLLLLLMLLYFGINFFGVRIDAWTAASIGFTLSTAAFLAEIWRGCINSVPKLQWEGARALAFTFPQTLRLIILPQALRIALPPTVGYMVQVVKGTSVAALIGFTELARAGVQMNTITFEPILVFSTVSAIYFALCWPLSLLSRKLERRLHVGHVRVQSM